jgi:hypothetical protein
MVFLLLIVDPVSYHFVFSLFFLDNMEQDFIMYLTDRWDLIHRYFL